MTAYQQLEKRFKRLSALNNAMGILGWDQETMMPEGAAPPRAQVMSELNVMAHEMMTADGLPDLIAEAEESGSELGEWQRANLREIKRQFIHANAVPAELIERMTMAQSESVMTWRQARADNDFKTLAPKLDALFALIREEAQIKAEVLGVSPYEAMLDQYDPGRREAEIDTLFDDLAGYLPSEIQRIVELQSQGPAVIEPTGPFPVADQEALSRAVMEILDFPFDRGRIDTAAHPFSGGADGDIRITTRYETDDFTKSLMAVIHEVGHALYEDGRPEDWRGQPVGDACGMTIHESQSLLLEMQAGRSEAFIRFLVPTLAKTLNGEGPAWDPENILRVYRRVQPGLIRVYADEVTYPLHVILRYKLEKAILNDDIAIMDLPAAWNDLMQTYLGLTPDTDSDGVMQDIHWPAGLFGYFPTYSLGALTAAQLFAAATKADPEIVAGLSRGDFKPLYAWLNVNVRGVGRLHLPDSLIENATGSGISTAAFKANIRSRYC